MHLSPFFHHLRSAYAAELEDLRCDSEGLVVLDQRLAQRRREIDFLVHMLEESPEMVATVLHRAFRFPVPGAMQELLTREPEDLPEWDSLRTAIEVADWAQGLVATLQAQPAGDWFLCVAAGLEYLHASHHLGAEAGDSTDGDDSEESPEQADNEDGSPLSADDLVESDGRSAEEAAADWMAEQGFERKE
ncbi:MAG: hypothetical protein U1F00_00140 [Rhodoferax sp.]